MQSYAAAHVYVHHRPEALPAGNHISVPVWSPPGANADPSPRGGWRHCGRLYCTVMRAFRALLLGLGVTALSIALSSPSTVRTAVFMSLAVAAHTTLRRYAGRSAAHAASVAAARLRWGITDDGISAGAHAEATVVAVSVWLSTTALNAIALRAPLPTAWTLPLPLPLPQFIRALTIAALIAVVATNTSRAADRLLLAAVLSVLPPQAAVVALLLLKPSAALPKSTYPLVNAATATAAASTSASVSASVLTTPRADDLRHVPILAHVTVLTQHGAKTAAGIQIQRHTGLLLVFACVCASAIQQCASVLHIAAAALLCGHVMRRWKGAAKPVSYDNVVEESTPDDDNDDDDDDDATAVKRGSFTALLFGGGAA